MFRSRDQSFSMSNLLRYRPCVRRYRVLRPRVPVPTTTIKIHAWKAIFCLTENGMSLS